MVNFFSKFQGIIQFAWFFYYFLSNAGEKQIIFFELSTISLFIQKEHMISAFDLIVDNMLIYNKLLYDMYTYNISNTLVVSKKHHENPEFFMEKQ